MKYKLEEMWLKLIKEASDTVGVDYTTDIDADDYIEVDVLLELIEELNYAVKHVQDELDDFKNEVDEYYEPKYKDSYEYQWCNQCQLYHWLL